MFSARLGFFQGAAAAAPQDVLFTTGAAPYIASYIWADSTGYGTRYSNPASAGSNGRGITMKTDNSVVFESSLSTPWINAWAYTVGTGFGSKYSNPASLAGSAPEEVAWNNTTSSIISCDSTTPYLHAWAWSSGFGTKYSNPGTLAGGACDAVQFNYAGNVVATGPSVSPFIVAYAWSSSGFGTKFSNPAVFLTAEPFGISFGLADNFMLITTTGAGRLISYTWNNTTGFSTQISSIGISSAGSSQGSSLNNAGTYVFLADDNNNFGQSYTVNSTGTIGATPTNTVSTGAIGLRGLAVNKKTDASVAFAGSSAPCQAAFPVTGGTFGTKYANPAVAVDTAGRDVVFTN